MKQIRKNKRYNQILHFRGPTSARARGMKMCIFLINKII